MRKQEKTIDYDINIYDVIRKNIRKYRMERGLTSAQLSEMVGISHDYLRQIESKKIAKDFSVETLYRISLALNVSLDDLIKNN